MTVLGKQQWDDAFVAGFKAGLRAYNAGRGMSDAAASAAWKRVGAKYGADYGRGYRAVVSLAHGAYDNAFVDDAIKLGLVKPGVQKLAAVAPKAKRNPAKPKPAKVYEVIRDGDAVAVTYGPYSGRYWNLRGRVSTADPDTIKVMEMGARGSFRDVSYMHIGPAEQMRTIREWHKVSKPVKAKARRNPGLYVCIAQRKAPGAIWHASHYVGGVYDDLAKAKAVADKNARYDDDEQGVGGWSYRVAVYASDARGEPTTGRHGLEVPPVYIARASKTRAKRAKPVTLAPSMHRLNPARKPAAKWRGQPDARGVLYEGVGRAGHTLIVRATPHGHMSGEHKVHGRVWNRATSLADIEDARAWVRDRIMQADHDNVAIGPVFDALAPFHGPGWAAVKKQARVRSADAWLRKGYI